MSGGLHHILPEVKSSPVSPDAPPTQTTHNGASGLDHIVPEGKSSTPNLDAQATLNGGLHRILPQGKSSKPNLVSDAPPTQTSSYKILERSIDDPRPMKVVVIGAGFSGIIAGIRFPQRVRNLDLTIYEAEDDIGGTWHVNKYPGLACDIPAHCYQLTFEPNPDWSAFYAPGPEIKAYLHRVVQKYKVLKYVRLNHRVTSATWDPLRGKWDLTILNRVTNTTITDEADFVLGATGGLSRWKWPDIEGLEEYTGVLLHSANWDSDLGKDGPGKQEQWKEKRVAVIGVGSSAIQIVPPLQKICKEVVNFVRGQTWIATPFASEYVLKRQPDGSNYTFSAEEKQAFKDDPEEYFKWRKELETELNSVHGATQVGHKIQQMAREGFKGMMEKKLEKRPWIADHLIPDFPVACRRLTPGPGFLEALCEDNVQFVPTGIKRFTPHGIETTDGKQFDFDVIVCATGFDTSFIPRMKVTGRDGMDLGEEYQPHPRTYLSLTQHGFPNWFQTLGPNAGVGSGSLLVMLERQIDYIVKVVQKLQRERYKSIEVKKEAVDEFDKYLEAYFPQTVYGQKCRSWYKRGMEEGRVTALWPGSCLHAVTAWENPRWEDYNYELEENGNRLRWLGDGWTENERNESGDRSWYLEGIDYPPVPEE